VGGANKLISFKERAQARKIPSQKDHRRRCDISLGELVLLL